MRRWAPTFAQARTLQNPGRLAHRGCGKEVPVFVIRGSGWAISLPSSMTVELALHLAKLLGGVLTRERQ
jgi:hypothetical protein